MLLTQEGLHALADFTISAALKYDIDGHRVEGNDGLTLICNQRHEGKTPWQWHWPGHVAAPILRDLALVAEGHWRKEHHEPQTTDAKSEVAK
jgi:hypothetical protein